VTKATKRKAWFLRLRVELSYLFSRQNASELVAEWYGRSAYPGFRYEREGLYHKVFFSKDRFKLASDTYWGIGKSLFRKLAERRAIFDALMEEAGRYHWEEET
jgi:hypothetical protein